MARINKATIVLFHSIINSNNTLSTDTVLQQEKSNLPDTFHQMVSETGKLLDIDIRSDTIKWERKSEWNKMCKERIQKSLSVKPEEQGDTTKLRIVTNIKWEMKDYIRKGGGAGSLIQQVITIGLNMTDQKRNYQNKYGEKLKCPLCDVYN